MYVGAPWQQIAGGCNCWAGASEQPAGELVGAATACNRLVPAPAAAAATPAAVAMNACWRLPTSNMLLRQACAVKLGGRCCQQLGCTLLVCQGCGLAREWRGKGRGGGGGQAGCACCHHTRAKSPHRPRAGPPPPPGRLCLLPPLPGSEPAPAAGCPSRRSGCAAGNPACASPSATDGGPRRLGAHPSARRPRPGAWGRRSAGERVWSEPSSRWTDPRPGPCRGAGAAGPGRADCVGSCFLRRRLCSGSLARACAAATREVALQQRG